MIAIVDFGSQFTHVIARRIRSFGVKTEVFPWNVKAEQLHTSDGVIFSGGPMSVYEKNAPAAEGAIYQLGKPMLGICYGMQLFAHQLGGRVDPGKIKEYGPSTVTRKGPSAFFQNCPMRFGVWMSHGDRVARLPRGFVATVSTDDVPIVAMEDRGRKLFAVQFHPEVTHTQHGRTMLENFVLNVCKAPRDWKLSAVVDETIAVIRQKVGRGHALCALSGGVDSSVAAALVHRAIGQRLTCVFIDHGMLRKDEASSVRKAFGQHLHANLRMVDTAALFLRNLRGVGDPEKKRKIIGETFIRVFEKEARKLQPRPQFLVQGTIYSDVIESQAASASSAKIKTHHNVAGLPEKFDFTLVEPLRFLFKDEVREVGIRLGLPDEIVWRQPFPGPGLAVRILGEVTKEKIRMTKEADAVVREEIDRSGLTKKLFMSFAVFPNVLSTGVKGDARSYEHVIAVRAIESTDVMTAHWAQLPHELLDRISTRIVNEVAGVNRVVYDVTNKPPATMEWE